MKSSMKDKVKSMFHQVKGKVKEMAGRITGNPRLEAKGIAERMRSVRFWGSNETAYQASDGAFGLKISKNNGHNHKRKTCHEENKFHIPDGGGGGSADDQRARVRFHQDGLPHRIIG